MIRHRASVRPKVMVTTTLGASSAVALAEATIDTAPLGHPIRQYREQLVAAVRERDPSYLVDVIGAYVSSESWPRVLALGAHPAGYVGTMGFPVFGEFFMNLLFFEQFQSEV